MKLTKTLAVVMAAAFALPMVATAGEAMKDGASQTDSTIVPAQAAEGKFNALDVNQDGVIDRNEAAADPKLATSFDQVDLTGTGEITIEEFSAWEEISESSGTPAN
jgi:Ca2+-binding EF-hand superfamily protein